MIMRAKSYNRKGATLVEFAIVLPLLFMVFGAVFEIGRMLLLQQSADTAAYEGARCAMVPGATADESVAAAQKLLKQANLTDTKVTINPPVIEEHTGAISVHVDVPLAKNCWFFKTWSSAFNVTSDVTLICERVPMIQLTGLPELKLKGGGGGGNNKLGL